jgi:hypothetical protein
MNLIRLDLRLLKEGGSTYHVLLECNMLVYFSSCFGASRLVPHLPHRTAPVLPPRTLKYRTRRESDVSHFSFPCDPALNLRLS